MFLNKKEVISSPRAFKKGYYLVQVSKKKNIKSFCKSFWVAKKSLWKIGHYFLPVGNLSICLFHKNKYITILHTLSIPEKIYPRILFEEKKNHTKLIQPYTCARGIVGLFFKQCIYHLFNQQNVLSCSTITIKSK